MNANKYSIWNKVTKTFDNLGYLIKTMFFHVTVNSTILNPKAIEDTLTLKDGANISMVGDTGTNTVTINVAETPDKHFINQDQTTAINNVMSNWDNIYNSCNGFHYFQSVKTKVVLDSASNVAPVNVVFDPSVDVLLAFENSIYIEEGDCYHYDSTAKTINKLEGTWDAGTNFLFVVLKQKVGPTPLGIKTYKYQTVLASSATSVLIDIQFVYNSDALMVFQNSTYIEDGIGYTYDPDTNSIIKKDTATPWAAGTLFSFIIIKQCLIEDTQLEYINNKFSEVDSKLTAITNPPIVSVTGNKTLALAEANTVQKVTSAATITVPLNNNEPFTIGCEIVIVSYTTSDVAIVPASGVTLYSSSSFRKINGQYTAVTLKKMGTNEWILIGSLKA